MAPEDLRNIIVACASIALAFAGGYVRKRLDRKTGLESKTLAETFNRQALLKAYENLYVIRLIFKTLAAMALSLLVYIALKSFPITVFFLVVALVPITYYLKVKKSRSGHKPDDSMELENLFVAFFTMIFIGIYVYKDLVD